MLAQALKPAHRLVELGLGGGGQLGGGHRLGAQEEKRFEDRLQTDLLVHQDTACIAGRAEVASMVISPKGSPCVHVASPCLWSSSNANRVTAIVTRSARATASSNVNLPARSSARRWASRSATVIRGEAMCRMSTGSGTRSKPPRASASRDAGYTATASSSDARRRAAGSGAERNR